MPDEDTTPGPAPPDEKPPRPVPDNEPPDSKPEVLMKTFEAREAEPTAEPRSETSGSEGSRDAE